MSSYFLAAEECQVSRGRLEATNAVPTVRPLTATIAARYALPEALTATDPSSARASPFKSARATTNHSAARRHRSTSSDRNIRGGGADDDVSTSPNSAATASSIVDLRCAPILPPPQEFSKSVLYNEETRQQRRELLATRVEEVLNEERKLNDILLQREKAALIKQQVEEEAREKAREAALAQQMKQDEDLSRQAIAQSPWQYQQQPLVQQTLTEKYGGSFLFGLNVHPSSLAHNEAEPTEDELAARRRSSGAESAALSASMSPKSKLSAHGATARHSGSSTPGGGGSVRQEPHPDIAHGVSVTLRCLTHLEEETGHSLKALDGVPPQVLSPTLATSSSTKRTPSAPLATSSHAKLNLSSSSSGALPAAATSPQRRAPDRLSRAALLASTTADPFIFGTAV